MVTCCLWSQKLNIFLKSVQQHPKLFCSASSLCYNIILWQLCAHLQECWTWPPPAYCRQMHAGLWLHSSLMEDGERRGSAAHHNVDVTASFASWCVKTFTALHNIYISTWLMIHPSNISMMPSQAEINLSGHTEYKDIFLGVGRTCAGCRFFFFTLHSVVSSVDKGGGESKRTPLPV